MSCTPDRRFRDGHSRACKPREEPMQADIATQAPVTAIDPFSEAFAKDPYPFHEELRELGPVIRLERYGIFGMARHAEVHAALNDWQSFISGAGAGIQDLRSGKAWRRARSCSRSIRRSMT